MCLWKGKAVGRGTRVKKRGEGKVRLRESSARCQQKGETKPAGQSEEGESGKPREGKEVGKEEGKAGGFRGRSRCNFCGRLSRRSRRGKRRIQSQSVSQAAAGGGERRRIKDGHQPLRGTATAPHFPGWSLRGGPALMERRSPRSAEAEAAAAAAAGTQRGGGGRRGKTVRQLQRSPCVCNSTGVAPDVQILHQIFKFWNFSESILILHFSAFCEISPV